LLANADCLAQELLQLLLQASVTFLVVRRALQLDERIVESRDPSEDEGVRERLLDVVLETETVRFSRLQPFHDA